MNAIRAEFLKLRRSQAWAIVVLLPLIMAISAVVNTLVAGTPLEGGWHTLWMRALVVYGLFPLAVGIGLLASLVWRPEHRGTNWNALMSGPTSSMSVVVAKSAAVGGLAFVMQGVMLVAVVVLGKVAFGLPGMLPGQYWLIALLVAVACVPVAALQSALSMLIRSFAVPVAIALVGAGASTVLLTVGVDAIILVSPYGLVSRATQFGTGTFADDGGTGAGLVATLLLASAALAAVVVWVSARTLDRRDART